MAAPPRNSSLKTGNSLLPRILLSKPVAVSPCDIDIIEVRPPAHIPKRGIKLPRYRTHTLTTASHQLPSPAMLFPSANALSATFGQAAPYKAQPQASKRTPYQARSELYGAWNVSEDAKQKTAQLSDAAVKEYTKASEAAQAKAGKIELYSGKYCKS